MLENEREKTGYLLAINDLNEALEDFDYQKVIVTQMYKLHKIRFNNKVTNPLKVEGITPLIDGRGQ